MTPLLLELLHASNGNVNEIWELALALEQIKDRSVVEPIVSYWKQLPKNTRAWMRLLLALNTLAPDAAEVKAEKITSSNLRGDNFGPNEYAQRLTIEINNQLPTDEPSDQPNAKLNQPAKVDF